jgi:hypothetical protein
MLYRAFDALLESFYLADDNRPLLLGELPNHQQHLAFYKALFHRLQGAPPSNAYYAKPRPNSYNKLMDSNTVLRYKLNGVSITRSPSSLQSNCNKVPLITNDIVKCLSMNIDINHLHIFYYIRTLK